jgi:tetratricopeptide (TPR) repeat protein
MTNALIHILFIVTFLWGITGCSQIHPVPVAPAQSAPPAAQPVSDTSLWDYPVPEHTLPPGPPTRDPQMSARYHYLSFLMLHRQNQFDAAVAALEEAIALDPESSFLKRDLVRAYLGIGRDETALSLVESLVEQNPDDVENLLMLVRLKREDIREQDMYPLLERILELDPENRETYLRLGKIYMDNQQIPEALELFSRMAARMPDYYVAQFYLGEAHFLSGNYQEAEQAFLKTIDLEPDLIEPRFRLVDILQDPENPAEKADPDRLLSMYEQILDIEPENDRARLETALLYQKTGQTGLAAQQFNALGNEARHNTRLLMTAVDLYLSQNRYEDAVTVFSGMYQADPENDNFNFFLGMAHESSRNPEQAVAHYLKVSPAHPQYKKTLLTIAFLYREMNQPQRAVAFLEQHHRQTPEDIDILTYLAAFYEKDNQLEEAMALISKGLEDAPESTSLLFRLGAVQDKAGLKDACIATMKEVIRLDPEDASALNYLGYTYADLGIHLDEAETLIRKALDIKPDDAYIIDSMGWVYYRQEKYDKAVEYLERAAELTDFEAIIAAHLGDAYIKTGQTAKALEAYRKALAHAEESDKALIEEVTEKIRHLEQIPQEPDDISGDPLP